MATPGQAFLEFAQVCNQTAVTRAQAGNPLTLLVPRPRGQSAWVYAGSLGGGFVAGDQVKLAITAGPGTRGFLSTQASTKVYRSPDKLPCRYELSASIGAGAVLVVAPDPVQCFADALYEQRQSFHLAPGAGLVLVDWLVSGRHARGERWAFTRYRSRVDIHCGDDHLLCDSLLLDPADGALDSPYRMGRFDCLALVVVLGEPVRRAAEGLLEFVAAQPIERQSTLLCSASPLRQGALLRCAGQNPEQVTQFIRRQLAFVRELLGDDPWERKW